MSRTIMLPALLLVLALAGVSRAIIKPHFTPIHLTQEADLIIAGPLQATADPLAWKLSATTAIKGKSAATLVVSLIGCDQDHLEQVQQTLKDNRQPAILFCDTNHPNKRARLHVMGQWLALTAGEKDTWKVVGPAPDMVGTFAGGTDMLIRMVQYIVRDSDPEVPVSVGVRWAAHVKVGNLPGEIAGMTAVDSGKGANPLLFVGSSAGDRLFQFKSEDSVADVTAASGLGSKSRHFTWIDLSGDGLSDLVSWDGETLSVRLAAKDGALKAAKVFSLRLGTCLGLAPCSIDGRPGVLVSGPEAPLLLVAEAQGWKKVELPRGPDPLGQPSACIVADLDNDGFADVLQPGEDASIFWKGKAGGFAKPVRIKVATRGGTALAAVGDFSQDGLLDIFLAGREKNTLWENDGQGGFREVLRYGGSISYKCPAGASDIQVMDLNHDGRQDLCLAYERNDLLYHFNRGFRSFGEEGELRLPGTQTNPGEPRLWPRAVACADFNADGSGDLAVILTNGDLYCYFNDKMNMPGVRLRLAPGVTGPVTASCWIDEKFLTCTGALPVEGHWPAAQLSTRTPGECKIKYRLPGRPEEEQKVTVENGPKDVILGPQAARF